jgi:molybdenum cofactor guanylyltransferase
MGCVNGVAVFVLAGGRSRRMGQDKALLPMGDSTLLERVLRTATALTANVHIVGSAQKYAGTVIEDQYAGQGPLAGVHAALSFSRYELNLILAVDLPFVSTELLRYLVQEAGRDNQLVTVPHAGGRLQPLCAVYRRGFVRLAADSLARGANKIDTLFEQCSRRIISEDELASAGFGEESFANVNTPEDLAAARRRTDNS